jgi:hypothetical protein
MRQFWKDEHFSVRWNDIPESARWRGAWKDFCRWPRNGALRYLFVMYHKSEQGCLGNLNAPAGLTYLYLLSSNARTIGSVPAGLRRLELHRCVKLESADGLAESCPELRHLHLDISKKFGDLPNLLKLKKLEVLCLNRCGDLPNLKFLAKFPNLRDFRFVDTNVVDGDLSPLLSLPNLESVGTLNKKHYSPTADEVKETLASRSGARRRRTSG